MSGKPIAILGAGPAGLMAAYACVLSGRSVSVFGQAGVDGILRQSRIGGAQFLHEPLPHINDEENPDTTIEYLRIGSNADYRRKVYGEGVSEREVPFVSMQFVQQGRKQPAWNLQATYETLWEELRMDVTGNVEYIHPAWITTALEKNWFERFISTIPATSLCWAMHGAATVPHTFASQEILIHNEAQMDIPDSTILYAADHDISWYRCSRIFGVGSTEWSAVGPAPKYIPADELVHVRKPLWTNCTCWMQHSSPVLQTGRFGAWRKGVLSHQAFTDTMKWLGGGSAL